MGRKDGKDESKRMVVKKREGKIRGVGEIE